MIDLYTWGTPNGRKVSIMLEEVGLPYTVHRIDISKNDQFTPEFIAINPNSKIPAIVDGEGPGGKQLAIFESGAILIYLAEKTGQLMPREVVARLETLEWLMFQMAGVGPMFGQRHHFARFAPEKVPYAIDRYTREVSRLYGVLDRQLEGRQYIAGEFSIADIATYQWVARWEWHDVAWSRFPHVERWFKALSARPAVQRCMAVP